MSADFDRSNSLQELENKDWGEPTYSSYLVTTVYDLRHKPLSEYSVEDLRIMIGQQVGLPYLLPLAIERLTENPLAEGDYFRGDLLYVVLSVKPEFWEQHKELWCEVHLIALELGVIKGIIDDQLMPALEKFEQGVESFWC